MATPSAEYHLPLLYNGLEPLNSNQHAKAQGPPRRPCPAASRKTHAIPVTVDEFALVQRTSRSSFRPATIRCRWR